MKCWNCGVKQGLLCGGTCYVCQGEIPPQKTISEESAAIFCTYHWEVVSDFRGLLHEIGEIFGVEIQGGRIKEFIEKDGFEDAKKKFKLAHQSLKNETKTWMSFYEEEITKVRVKLAQWTEKVESRMK